MVGNVDGPGRNASKPLLPHRLRRPNRTLKQRERDVPDVDWEHSLQHFASAVSHDLDELNSRFVHEHDLTFSAWKRLWNDMRMSAAFHVEFWESTPTNTHKTILQQAVGGLVGCIEERDGEFDTSADIALLIGRVFAMFCAYSVQLSSPKLKFDVDPQAWTALLSVNCVMTGVGAKFYPLAARQVRAMMHQLIVQENAFAYCLQGFGPNVRSTDASSKAKPVNGQDNSIVEGTATEKTVVVDRNSLERLKTLNDRYEEVMSRARIGLSVNKELSSRQAKPIMSTSCSLPSETGKDRRPLAHALMSYMEYKANEETRKCDRIVRAATVREQEARNMLTVTRKDCNILKASDCGSGNTKKWVKGYNGKDSSETSEADIGLLADLERELEQSVSILSSRTQARKTAIPQKTVPRRKRGRNSLAVSAAKHVSVECTVTPTKRARSDSVSSRLSLKDSWAVSSTVDNDALAALQAELDVAPAVSHPRNSVNAQQSCIEVESSTANCSITHVKAKPTSRRDGNCARESRKTPIQPPTTRLRALSVHSGSSELLAQLQADLDRTAESAPSAPGRLTRSCSVASQSQCSASEVLEKEESEHVAINEAVSPPLRLVFTKTGTSKRGKACTDGDAQPHKRTTRSSARLRLDGLAVSAVLQTATTQTEDTKQQDDRSVPVLRQEFSSVSSTSSDTESDGLAELVAELNTTNKVQRLSQLHPESLSVKRVCPRSTGQKRSAAPVNTGTSHPDQFCSVAAPFEETAKSFTQLSSVASDSKSDGLDDMMAELERDPGVGFTATNIKKPRKKQSNRGQIVKLRQNQAKAGPKASRSARQSVVSDVPTKPINSRRSGNLRCSRRSTRSSSVALESDSDGLAELEAELRA
ncbi:hypothetical protein PsorP6_016675 [Peronosclerospora sorghi]|uniref:Uncharacterized protein n=1 Tax=Peronosclerospora sorghi TaxID=230839 RepID=A0ACC0VP39_9STRA|nr:hypothetical protein PsorP6_016675 [Peronosclerospora sorghi]